MESGYDGLLDTNVFIRHFMGDHPNQSPRATEFLASVARGERLVRVSDCVVFEVVFVLHKTYGISREHVQNEFGQLLAISGIVLPEKHLFAETFELWSNEAGLSFVDCYQLCFARHLEPPRVDTFDRKMNRLPDVECIEP